jgi:DNA-binding GntR family transcriptional regulator
MDKLATYLAEQANHIHIDGALRLREVAYERLKDALQHAGLTPGEPLSENQLSKWLGISRTPVREALQQLAQEGLVQVIPGRAITVASRSLKEVLDVVHIRSLLEPELVRLVAESATEQQIETLQQTIEKMEDAIHSDDYAAWAKADTVFHALLNDACPNRLLGETSILMRNRVHHIADSDSKVNPARLAACTAEHRQIVDAIAAHDSKAAEQAVREHLAALRTSLLNRLSYGG